MFKKLKRMTAVFAAAVLAISSMGVTAEAADGSYAAGDTIAVSNLGDLKAGTYGLDADLSCYITAMGGVEFGASLLTGTELNVEEDGTAEMTLSFGTAQVTIYGITVDTYVGEARYLSGVKEPAVMGILENGSWKEVAYTFSPSVTATPSYASTTGENSVSIIDTMTVPVSEVADTYNLAMVVDSSFMGMQFGADSNYAATLTVDWTNVTVKSVIENDGENNDSETDTAEATVKAGTYVGNYFKDMSTSAFTHTSDYSYIMTLNEDGTYVYACTFDYVNTMPQANLNLENQDGGTEAGTYTVSSDGTITFTSQDGTITYGTVENGELVTAIRPVVTNKTVDPTELTFVYEADAPENDETEDDETADDGTTDDGTTDDGTTDDGTTDDGSVNNGTTNNGAANNGTVNNGSSNNGTTNNGSSNNGTTDNSSTNNTAAGTVISVSDLSKLEPGTYGLSADLSCYVNAMGGVEFGSSLLKGAVLNVAEDGTKTITLTFGTSSVTIYSVTANTYVSTKTDDGAGFIGYYDNGTWKTATYTLNSAGYVETMTFPITELSNTYNLALVIGSDVMSTQFGNGANYNAVLTVNWDKVTVGGTGTTAGAGNGTGSSTVKTGDVFPVLPILGILASCAAVYVILNNRKREEV